MGNQMPQSSVPHPGNLQTREDIYRWISQGIGTFKEWYQPVNFGNGLIAHETLPPDWTPHPERLNDIGGGLAKWNYIVKKHIPDVSGKRVLDLGCSSGLFSIELARMGAREVVGIDRDTTFRHRSTNVPPPQDVIAQANFVKRAFELLEGVSYPIRYVAKDIARLEELNLGNFDLIMSLCVVYHELDRMAALVEKLSRMTDCLVLQANQVHGGELGKYSDKMYHVKLLSDLGFTHIEIDAPSGYMLPLIVGRK